MNGGKFLGHSIGLTMDESPAIANRFKEVLTEGMTFALEPKIALPGIGMVGSENTYLVTANGGKALTARRTSCTAFIKTYTHKNNAITFA